MTNSDARAVATLPAPLADVEPDALARQLAEAEPAARREGGLDIAYRTIDTPVGSLLLAATAQGLVRVAFAREDHDRVMQLLAEKISPRIVKAPGRLEPAARQVDEYLAGRRNQFDLVLDFRLADGFRRSVLAHLPKIPYGDTASYAEVALATGRPLAVRAVGTACARNPLPVVVPCHRVVRSDGSFGGYVGGPEAKHALLTLEAAT